jgi:hypothetical protein
MIRKTSLTVVNDRRVDDAPGSSLSRPAAPVFSLDAVEANKLRSMYKYIAQLEVTERKLTLNFFIV